MTRRRPTGGPRSGPKAGPATMMLLAVLAAIPAGLAASCGGDPVEDATGSDPDLAFTADGNGSDAGSEPADRNSDDAPASGDHEHRSRSTTTAVGDGRGDADAGEATTPTTIGSGLPPVTTIAVSPGGDPDGIYRGVLGALDPDEVVVAGAVVPPRAEPGVLPLTGLPGTVPDRPAAAVKIDNGTRAHPQTGLNAADIVIEEEVEGGVTRFAAIFHSTPSIVGPVRSGRTTDIGLISSLGSPLMIYSGANDITEGILRAQPAIQNRSEAGSSGYWRDPARRAPSNLYTDTAPHWASAAGGPPPPQFVYRDRSERTGPGAADDELTVAYGGSSVRWHWDGQRWLRWQRGAEHLVASGRQVSAANVVVIEAERVDTGMVDGNGGPVPEFVFVGSGRATVFSDGRRVTGTWTRPTLNSVATLTHSPGRAIELTPGRTWVQLIEAGSGQLG